MCGIFTIIYNNTKYIDEKSVRDEFQKGKNRGPENSKLFFNEKRVIGFHRLAINGLNSKSDQPITYKNITLICNGEIYNYKQLYKYMDNFEPTTDSDCEVIIHLYMRYGIEQTLTMLDGVYAFVLYDDRNENNVVYVARDPFGVRPLYQMTDFYDGKTCFSSELKCLVKMFNEHPTESRISQFEPGTYSCLKYDMKTAKYFIPSFSFTRLTYDVSELEDEFLINISKYLNVAVYKRCKATDRPVACLLSGGLDSSLIASLVANYFREKKQKIETYSIGLEGSEDVKNARIVADYIGSKHTEIIVTEEEMFKAIPEVIYAIESYDTTTVRASIGNYLIGKYISQNSDAKVIFNGDGSDELFGGYLYMHKCSDDIEFDKETRRLLKDIYLFDVLRSDKSISSNGLEPRTPFLDRSFVNYVLSIPPYFRNHNNFKESEKYLLRKSFKYMYFEDTSGRQILPDEILFRRKEAFSDGVSSQGRSLFTILQEYISRKYNEQPSIELEKRYYREIFDEFYPNCQHIVPYFWMPKYITNTNDPSARTLDLYNANVNA